MKARFYPFTQSTREGLGRRDSEALRVMTLNLAHGRGRRAHQLFLSDDTVRSHLREVAAILEREQIDVAAFQECDIASFWNGNFNHLEYVSTLTRLGYGVTAEHMQGMKLRYGSGILSALPIGEVEAHRFLDSLPMPRKGFVLGEVLWSEDSNFSILVVSIHLDFLRHGHRRRQIDQVVAAIQQRQIPAIVMGDFNCDWNSSFSALRYLADACKLRAYEPQNSELVTFPLTRKKWDWVLLSQGLRFRDYRVLEDRVSDHRAIVAEVERE